MRGGGWRDDYSVCQNDLSRPPGQGNHQPPNHQTGINYLSTLRKNGRPTVKLWILKLMIEFFNGILRIPERAIF